MNVRIAVAARGALACIAWLTLAPATRGAPADLAASAASANGAPLKPARSEFDIREFSTLFNNVLLVPHPGGALPAGSRSLRTIHGQVVDHSGQPIAGVQVGLAPSLDYYGQDYFENFDKTDELGRFVVQANDRRRGLVVHRGEGRLVKVSLAGDEEFVRVAWPAPSRVRVTVDPELCEPGATLLLGKTKTVLGPDGTATFEDLMPGDLRLDSLLNFVADDGHRESVRRELVRTTIGAGEDREVQADGAGRIPVRGKVETGWCIIIQRERTRSDDRSGGVDGALIDDGGRFLAHVPGPGVYRLVVKAGPAKLVDEPGGNGLYINNVIDRRRFVVGAATQEVTLGPTPPVDRTVAFVHNTLDAEMPASYLNVTYSYSDVQVAQLVRHEDRAGVAAELLRIVKDPHAPQSWMYLTMQALGGMTDDTKVVDGLLELLDSPPDDLDVSDVIEALSRVDEDTPAFMRREIARRIVPLTRSEATGLRWRAHYCLGRMALKHPDIKPLIAPAVIAALGDEDERIRREAAARIGWLGIEADRESLRSLLADSDYRLRLAAARSLWQLTGDSAPLLKEAEQILAAPDDDYVAKKDAAAAIEDVSDLPGEITDALERHAKFDKRPPLRGHGERYQYQLASIAKRILAQRARAAIPED